MFEDNFTNVTVKDYQFKRSFKQSEVIHLRYRNDKLSLLIDGLFTDYGDLFGRILSSQKRKNQIHLEQLIWTCSLQRAKNTNQNCKSSLITCTKRLEKKMSLLFHNKLCFKYAETSGEQILGRVWRKLIK